MKLFKLNSQNLTTTAGRRVYVANPAMALLVLFGTFVAAFFIMSLVSHFLLGRLGYSTASLRISSVIQDILVFILPAIVTAVVATKLPATFLRIDCGVDFKTWGMSIVVLICASPALNYIILLNQSIELPEAFGKMEDNASQFFSLMQGGTSIGNLIISVLIIGVLAGFSEEIFFRGALLRLMETFKMNSHVAIWTAALIFSTIHFQFYGFVPRLLLGAYFGYIVLWSGSLWTAVIVHAFNNSLVVLMGWIARNANMTNLSETGGLTLNLSIQQIITLIISVAITVVGIIILRRNAIKSRFNHQLPNVN